MGSPNSLETRDRLSNQYVHESESHSCARCKGMLVSENLFDLLDHSGQMRRWAYRCIQCGDIVDPLIVLHRSYVVQPNPQNTHRRRWSNTRVIRQQQGHS